MPQRKYGKPASSRVEAQGSCTAQIHPGAGSALPSKCCCPKVEDKTTHILPSPSGTKIQVQGRARLLCQEDVQLVLFRLGVGRWGALPALKDPPFPRAASAELPGAARALHLGRQPASSCVGSSRQPPRSAAPTPGPLGSPSLALTPAPAPGRAESLSPHSRSYHPCARPNFSRSSPVPLRVLEHKPESPAERNHPPQMTWLLCLTSNTWGYIFWLCQGFLEEFWPYHDLLIARV